MFFSPKKEDNQNKKSLDDNQAKKAHLSGIDEYFSDQLRRILIAAAQEARNSQADEIDTEYLLLGLILKHDAVIDKIFTNLKIKPEEMEQEIRQNIKPAKNPPEKQKFSPRSKNVLELADKIRREFRHHATSSEHILLGLAREGEGIAAITLKRFGATPENIASSIEEIVGKGQEKDILTKSSTPMLDKYGIDICAKAREGKIDPVIGRTEEIERTSHILARRRKNNPVLIGEAGVGKTAIIEGLALRISIGDVPDNLKGKRIIEITLASLMSGASHRGDFEKRVEGIIKEAKDSAGEIILFIDELHTIISSSDTADVANIFKPALARGELHMVGATTNAEYHQYIESDRALERRFQPVKVDEPTFDETFEILKGIRDKYEAFHKVKISDDILQLAIKLTDRYINDRFLPDKAVDLIDESAAVAKMPSISTPAKIQQLEKSIEHLIGEREQAKKNINVNEITRIEKLINEKENELKEAKENFEEDKARSRDTIEESHLQNVMSMWTGVPLSHLKASESEKLMNLENKIHEKVIGQNEPVKAVAQAVRRGRAGLKKLNLPIGSFLFMGPTGVGKTQIAKTLAENLFGLESAIIRFDMSEFMEKHAISRLLGPPPGYVGYEKGGELTEAVRRMPFSIILFDEVEKAHPDVFRIFLQLLDDGRLTDNHGRTVSFKNTIIICTSNLAADKISEALQGGFPEDEELKKQFTLNLKNKVMPDILKFFKPEMVNRFDDLIFFEPLSQEAIKEIVDIFFQDTAKALQEQKMSIELTENVKEYIAKAGFDPQFGARPLKRMIRTLIDDPLSDMIIKGEFHENDHIVVSLNDKNGSEEIIFSKGSSRASIENINLIKNDHSSLEDRLLDSNLDLLESNNEKQNEDTENQITKNEISENQQNQEKTNTEKDLNNLENKETKNKENQNPINQQKNMENNQITGNSNNEEESIEDKIFNNIDNL